MTFRLELCSLGFHKPVLSLSRECGFDRWRAGEEFYSFMIDDGIKIMSATVASTSVSVGRGERKNPSVYL